jgi:hypothetical protein
MSAIGGWSGVDVATLRPRAGLADRDGVVRVSCRKLTPIVA